MANLFQPFQRGDIKPSKQGLGLGLISPRKSRRRMAPRLMLPRTTTRRVSRSSCHLPSRREYWCRQRKPSWKCPFRVIPTSARAHARSPPFHPRTDIGPVDSFAVSPQRERLNAIKTWPVKLLLPHKKQFRTFWPKSRGLEKLGAHRTKSALTPRERYGSARQKHCLNSGIAAASDGAENLLAEQLGGARATVIQHSPFLRRSTLSTSRNPAPTGMIAGDGITRRVAASGGTSLEPLDAAMEAIMAAVVIGYRYLHSELPFPEAIRLSSVRRISPSTLRQQRRLTQRQEPSGSWFGYTAVTLAQDPACIGSGTGWAHEAGRSWWT